MAVTVGEVQATLTLKDQMSSQMQQAAATSGQSLAQIQTALKQAQQALADYDAELQKWSGNATVLAAITPVYDEQKAKVADLEGQLQSLTAAQQDAAAASQQAASAASQQSGMTDEMKAKLEAYGIATTDSGRATKDLSSNNDALSNSMSMATPIISGLIAAFSVDKVISFAESLLEAAYDLNKLSIQTGISAEDLQGLGYAGAGVGVSADSLGMSISMMERRIADATPTAVAAVESLGLNFRDIQQMSPVEMFAAIGTKMKDLADHTDEVSVGYALMGRGARNTIALMNEDLQGLMEEAKKVGAEASDDTVKHLASVEAQGLRTWQTLKAAAMEYLDVAARFLNLGGQQGGTTGQFIDPKQQQVTVQYAASVAALAKSGKDAGDAMAGMSINIHTQADALPGLISKHDEFSNRLKALKQDALFPLSAQMKQDIAEGLQYGMSLQELAAKTQAPEIAIKNYEAQLKASQKSTQDWQKANQDLFDTLAGAPWDGTLQGALKAGVGIHTLAVWFGYADAYVRQVSNSMKEFAAVAKIEHDGKNLEGLGAALKGIGVYTTEDIAYMKAYADAYASNTGLMNDAAKKASEYQLQIDGDTYQQKLSKLTQWRDNAEGQIDYYADNWQTTLDQIEKAFGLGMQVLDDEHQHTLDKMYRSAKTWGEQWGDVIAKLPQELDRAFTGGGGFGGALKGIGVQVSSMLGDMFAGSNLGSSIGMGLAKILPNSMTGSILPMLSSMIPFGLSALAGPITDLFKHLFGGPSQQELQGRQTEGQFEQQMGGWQGIQKALIAAGDSADVANAKIQALWASEKQGQQAVQTVIDSINADIAKHTAAVSDGVDAVTAAAKTLGGTFPAALRPVVEQLEQLPGLTDAEKKSLTDMMNSGKPTFDQLVSDAKNYGLTLQDLGPKFQQGGLYESADKIISTFQELHDAGADDGAVIQHMGGQIGDLVEQALKYGLALPTALQPLVQNLSDTGQLADSTGKQIGDISKLKFDDSGDPLSQSINTLTDALNNLTDVLKNDLPSAAKAGAKGVTDALNSIPTDVHVRYDTSSDVNAVPMAAGGDFLVTQPTLFMAGEAGPEYASFSGAGGNLSGGSGQQVIQTVVYLNGRHIATAVNDVNDATMQRRRKLGSR